MAEMKAREERERTAAANGRRVTASSFARRAFFPPIG